MKFIPNGFCSRNATGPGYYTASCVADSITYVEYADSLCANYTGTRTIPITKTCSNITGGYSTHTCALAIPNSNGVGAPFNLYVTIPIIVGGLGLLILLFYGGREYRKYRQLDNLPIHKALRALKVKEVDVMDAIIRYPHTVAAEDADGYNAIELAVKRGMSSEILFELCKEGLPFDPESGEPVSDEIHNYAWVKLIQKDVNVEVVDIILDSNPSLVKLLSESKDATGRTALNLASPKCEKVIRESLYFLKQYEIVNFEDPEHISATCRLHIARDRKNNDQKVALKFMTDVHQFHREIEVRNNMHLSSDHVINLLAQYSSTDETMMGAQYRKEIFNRGLLRYPYMIVMPAGTKTLQTVIASEHIAGKEWHKLRDIAMELAHDLDHLHMNGVIHGDVKPLNIMRVGTTIKLIDLDAAVKIGEGFSCAKFSSAYIPPELIHNENGKCMVKSYKIDNATNLPITEDLPYDLVPASVAHDAWAYGVVLYELFTGKKLLFADCDDNIDEIDLLDVYNFTSSFKKRKLQSVPDPLARNLVSQLLMKDPTRRPTMEQVLAHSFISGRAAPRMLGEEPEFDVFISYRVRSDAEHAKLVYDKLTDAGFKVWLDQISLLKGDSWVEGFCDGLIKSRIFIPIISKSSINSESAKQSNFAELKADSKIDNVLLEYWLALELQHRGFVDKIYPLLVGSKGPDENDASKEVYNNFFTENGVPNLEEEVVVKEVEDMLGTQLERMCLGSAILSSLSVGSILTTILKNQGRLIEGEIDTAFDQISADVEQMKTRILAQGGSTNPRSRLVINRAMSRRSLSSRGSGGSQDSRGSSRKLRVPDDEEEENEDLDGLTEEEREYRIRKRQQADRTKQDREERLRRDSNLKPKNIVRFSNRNLADPGSESNSTVSKNDATTPKAGSDYGSLKRGPLVPRRRKSIEAFYKSGQEKGSMKRVDSLRSLTRNTSTFFMRSASAFSMNIPDDESSSQVDAEADYSSLASSPNRSPTRTPYRTPNQSMGSRSPSLSPQSRPGLKRRTSLKALTDFMSGFMSRTASGDQAEDDDSSEGDVKNFFDAEEKSTASNEQGSAQGASAEESESQDDVLVINRTSSVIGSAGILSAVRKSPVRSVPGSPTRLFGFGGRRRVQANQPAPLVIDTLDIAMPNNSVDTFEETNVHFANIPAGSVTGQPVRISGKRGTFEHAQSMRTLFAANALSGKGFEEANPIVDGGNTMARAQQNIRSQLRDSFGILPTRQVQSADNSPIRRSGGARDRQGVSALTKALVQAAITSKKDGAKSAKKSNSRWIEYVNEIDVMPDTLTEEEAAERVRILKEKLASMEQRLQQRSVSVPRQAARPISTGSGSSGSGSGAEGGVSAGPSAGQASVSIMKKARSLPGTPKLNPLRRSRPVTVADSAPAVLSSPGRPSTAIPSSPTAASSQGAASTADADPPTASPSRRTVKFALPDPDL